MKTYFRFCTISRSIILQTVKCSIAAKDSLEHSQIQRTQSVFIQTFEKIYYADNIIRNKIVQNRTELFLCIVQILWTEYLIIVQEPLTLKTLKTLSAQPMQFYTFYLAQWAIFSQPISQFNILPSNYVFPLPPSEPLPRPHS